MKKTNSLTLNLAFKNLSRQKKRSFLLGGAIAFGFFIVTAIDGLATGAVQNLESQITKLVGGSVIVQGVERLPSTEDGKKGKLTNIIRDPDFVKGILDKS
jgi:putative ABC transport system permease protein